MELDWRQVDTPLGCRWARIMVAVLAACSPAFSGCGLRRTPPQVLRASPAHIELCHLPRGKTQRLAYKIRNISDQDITLVPRGSSCGCFNPVISHPNLPPGGEALVELKVRVHDRERRGHLLLGCEGLASVLKLSFSLVPTERRDLRARPRVIRLGRNDVPRAFVIRVAAATGGSAPTAVHFSHVEGLSAVVSSPWTRAGRGNDLFVARARILTTAQLQIPATIEIRVPEIAEPAILRLVHD